MNWTASEWGGVTCLEQTESACVAGYLIFGGNQSRKTESISPERMTR
jgi:hypothetical protein